jgi:hypothetical protein
MKASHAIGLQVEEAWGDDLAVKVDAFDTFGAKVVVGCNEAGVRAEVEVLRNELAVDAEEAVCEAS